jgi:hypothetical protein
MIHSENFVEPNPEFSMHPTIAVSVPTAPFGARSVDDQPASDDESFDDDDPFNDFASSRSRPARKTPATPVLGVETPSSSIVAVENTAKEARNEADHRVQCIYCDKTYKSKASYGKHKTRDHKIIDRTSFLNRFTFY